MTNRFAPIVALVLTCGLAAPGAQTGKGSATSGAPGRDGAPGRGHVKPLPAFVKKHEKARIDAAERVARGQAAPSADGIVGLQLDFEVIGSRGAMIMVTAVGTAVRLRKV